MYWLYLSSLLWTATFTKLISVSPVGDDRSQDFTTKPPQACPAGTYYEPEIGTCQPCLFPCRRNVTHCQEMGCEVNISPTEEVQRGKRLSQPTAAARFAGNPKTNSTKRCPAGQYFDVHEKRCWPCSLPCRYSRHECIINGCMTEETINSTKAATPVNITTPETVRPFNETTSPPVKPVTTEKTGMSCPVGEYYEAAMKKCRPCSIPCKMSTQLCREMGCEGKEPTIGTTTQVTANPGVTNKPGRNCAPHEYFEAAIGLCRPCSIPCTLSERLCIEMGCEGTLAVTTSATPLATDKPWTTTCPAGTYYDVQMAACWSCDEPCSISRSRCKHLGCEGFYTETKTTPSPSQPSPATPSNHQLVVIGIGAGTTLAIVIVVSVAVVICCWLCRRRPSKKQEDGDLTRRPNTVLLEMDTFLELHQQKGGLHVENDVNAVLLDARLRGLREEGQEPDNEGRNFLDIPRSRHHESGFHSRTTVHNSDTEDNE